MKEFHKGYNCAQSVACTYCDLVGMKEEDVFRMTEAFGLGMGGMHATCGALAGAIALAGMKESSANLDKPDSKGHTYQIARELTETFLNEHTSLVCKELKGVETGIVLSTCPDCIKSAAAIVEELLFAGE